MNNTLRVLQDRPIHDIYSTVDAVYEDFKYILRCAGKQSQKSVDRLRLEQPWHYQTLFVAYCEQMGN